MRRLCKTWIFGPDQGQRLFKTAAYSPAEAEEFLTGSPLPVANAVVGNDGALYFMTGGRNQDSQLYRVVYRRKSQQNLPYRTSTGRQK